MSFYGALKPQIDVRDYRPAVGAVELPKFYSLPCLPQIKDQFFVNSCCAHATSSILEYFNQIETGSNVTLSTDFIYGMQDREGQGMYLRDACKIVQKYGDTYKTTFPKNTEQPACGKAVKAALTDEILAEAEYFQIASYANCRTEKEKKSAIYSGKPLLASIKWYDKYTKEDGVIHFDTSSDCGYHAVMVYGWNETGWLCQNSWGKSWGNKGRFVLPYEFGLVEAWAFTDEIKGNPAPKKLDWLYKVINWLLNLFNK